ncbi:hypothetical protein PV08_07058 [Exophiala spinifera]|uniref:Uncharacterized protein n=1 Tax=Exophiala spinifera TaxID=91928 RepID=A0A0D1YH30_9EURO|nr:uncharacterized protein PV08_07058 [Exophiala spinifera]KIW14276.1 hypothetical protein PV08_07058 [Exophiala spinifera]
MARLEPDCPTYEPNAIPIYRTFEEFANVGAAFTGKGTDPRTQHFSFQRPSARDTERSKSFRANLQQLARHVEFDSRQLVLPNGAWPHSGKAIKDEDYSWVSNAATGTLVPIARNNEPVTYDAIASRSLRHVLAVQGADCQAIFLYDPCSLVIGLAHAGWKPLVRNVVGNVIDAMEDLGATRHTIRAYISPGAGDLYNAFNWDDNMEESVREVFVQAGRDDLLAEPTIRHHLTSEDRAILRSALGREVPEGSSLKLLHLALTELKLCGVREGNISFSHDSTIVERQLAPDREGPLKYHSYRRERPDHGLSISVLFLRCSDSKGI